MKNFNVFVFIFFLSSVCEPKSSITSFDADISFMIADAKYSENNLKILEFGLGPLSGFKHYDAICGEGAIWAKFWTFLKKFNKPIWYVDPHVSKQVRYSRRRSFERKRRLSLFRNLGGTVVPSLRALAKSKKFKKAKRIKINRGDIKNYPGIVILKRPGNRWFCSCVQLHRKNKCRFCVESNAVKKFKRKYPNFLYLCEGGYSAGVYKAYSANLFDQAKFPEFKPQFYLCPKEYSSKTLNNILKHVTSDLVVVKPIASAQGKGIMMISRDDLGFVLKGIVNNPRSLKKIDPDSYKQWIKDKNNMFIVESLEQSKTLTKRGKSYDPTLRVVFAMVHSKGEYVIKFLDMYWKLPLHSLDEKVSLTDRYKSKHADSIKVAPSALLSKKEQHDVRRLMKKFMPSLYRRMLLDHSSGKYVS